MTQATAFGRQHWRMVKDVIARYGVGFGGISVIIAILLIFFYLLYVVFPLFLPASIERISQFPIPGSNSASLYLTMEEQAEIGLRVTNDGQMTFFNTADGGTVLQQQIAVPAGAHITSFAASDPFKRTMAFGYSDGRAHVVKAVYHVSYPDNVRTITPSIEYPYGEDAIVVDPDGKALAKLALQTGEENAMVVGVAPDGRVHIAHMALEESFLDDGVTVELNNLTLEHTLPRIDFVRIDKDQQELYLASGDGEINFFDIANPEEVELVQRLNLLERGVKLTSLEFLTGGISLLAGDSKGRITQWFPVRDQNNDYVLKQVRQFNEQRAPILGIAPEYGRKGFLAGDANGNVGIYHTTAETTLLVERTTPAGLAAIAIAPRADAMLVENTNGELQFWHIENEHPEVSWSALWRDVWYESYDEPATIWQSSSASNDFEPKFSLAPLAFGTLKAAFYAMLLAVPLAIMGAIYTAYFMSSRMRGLVKPTIEVMEALPTVILGFLAGLWLAPLLERYLPGAVALLLILPLGMLLFAFVWHRLPQRVQHLVPEGWYAALLVPVVIFLGWLAFAVSTPLEHWLFGSDIRQWITNDLGITFDQRNAMVVGFAMGFAVIPTIFSITEDAIFSVPRHLTQGSLALGATPWQTLARVVILTASPGIFSAVMIGLGRAVGETMIVLMATGNTPVMDFSIFQGMRTLSANIAVEMPESEVGSTHYRVLFLAALVLFLFTFIFNTLAEIIRQRLRKKYSSL